MKTLIITILILSVTAIAEPYTPTRDAGDTARRPNEPLAQFEARRMADMASGLIPRMYANSAERAEYRRQKAAAERESIERQLLIMRLQAIENELRLQRK